jgi:hypothetical protein
LDFENFKKFLKVAKEDRIEAHVCPGRKGLLTTRYGKGGPI